MTRDYSALQLYPIEEKEQSFLPLRGRTQNRGQMYIVITTTVLLSADPMLTMSLAILSGHFSYPNPLRLSTHEQSKTQKS